MKEITIINIVCASFSLTVHMISFHIDNVIFFLFIVIFINYPFDHLNQIKNSIILPNLYPKTLLQQLQRKVTTKFIIASFFLRYCHNIR